MISSEGSSVIWLCKTLQHDFIYIYIAVIDINDARITLSIQQF